VILKERSIIFIFGLLLMSRVLVDTNILIYSKDIKSLYHPFANGIFNSEDELFVTNKNLSEYYSVVTKGDHPLLTPIEAMHDLEEFGSICQVIYPNESSQQKLFFLIEKYKPKGLKIHDFEIVSIALAQGINKLVTLNKNDFREIDGLEIITPAPPIN
jgi:predicted nucleic acid-binding protein